MVRFAPLIRCQGSRSCGVHHARQARAEERAEKRKARAVQAASVRSATPSGGGAS